MKKSEIKITDKHGFIYRVDIEGHPAFGFATALYNGRIIHSLERQKLNHPFSDNDAEWEAYEERLQEWMADVHVDMAPALTEHFNKTDERS